MDETAGAVEEDVPWGRLRPHLPQNFAVFLENTAPQPLQVTSDMFVTRKTRGETRRIEKRKKEKCSIGGEGVFHDPHLKKPRSSARFARKAAAITVRKFLFLFGVENQPPSAYHCKFLRSY